MVLNEYIPPTPEELRAILGSLGLTGAKAAELVNVDSRTIRRWTGGDRKIPYQALFTLLLRSRNIYVTPDQWRVEIKSLLSAKK